MPRIKYPHDSFISTGVFDLAAMTRLPLSHTTSATLSPPLHLQHFQNQSPSHQNAPASYPFPRTSSPSPYHNSPNANTVPISPPRTRSASAETSSAALVEDFRLYTHKLRDQYEGERSHMVADRARAIEVMTEERALWDKERQMYIARIKYLEAKLHGLGEAASPGGIFSLDSNVMDGLVLNGNARFNGSGNGNGGTMNGSTNGSGNTYLRNGLPPRTVGSPGSGNGSDGKKSSPHSHMHPEVKQESGRNADGSPFYAPAPRNPTRTFTSEDSEVLRVEDIVTELETPLRIPNKELSASDFSGGSHQSPEVDRIVHWQQNENEADHHPEPAMVGDSIDISLIDSHLEGVSIKASAVDPVFVAKVLSPRCSSPSRSPDIKPPARPVDVANEKQFLGERENKRLTMYAGHTPNHSISRFSDLVKESAVEGDVGDETPRNVHAPHPSAAPHSEDQTVADEMEDEEDGDRELSGALGLTNKKSSDDLFIEALTEKLEVVQREKSAAPSPSLDSTVCDSPVLEMKNLSLPAAAEATEDVDANEEEEGEGEEEDAPPLKLKPSMNFGVPLGKGFR